jgi:hypothetical protein
MALPADIQAAGGALSIEAAEMIGSSADAPWDGVAGTATLIAAAKRAAQGAHAQTSALLPLATAVTGTGGQTAVPVDGYNGAQVAEVIAVGTVAAQAVTFQLEGSMDSSNWYIAGAQQIDATASPSRTAAGITLTPGAGTLRHVYQVLDAYKYLRINITANTLGTGLTASLYAVPV